MLGHFWHMMQKGQAASEQANAIWFCPKNSDVTQLCREDFSNKRLAKECMATFWSIHLAKSRKKAIKRFLAAIIQLLMTWFVVTQQHCGSFSQMEMQKQNLEGWFLSVQRHSALETDHTLDFQH